MHLAIEIIVFMQALLSCLWQLSYGCSSLPSLQSFIHNHRAKAVLGSSSVVTIIHFYSSPPTDVFYAATQIMTPPPILALIAAQLDPWGWIPVIQSLSRHY